jgi:hypothetical protein
MRLTVASVGSAGISTPCAAAPERRRVPERFFFTFGVLRFFRFFFSVGDLPAFSRAFFAFTLSRAFFLFAAAFFRRFAGESSS